MDWTKLLSEISATGATQKEIADFCGCAQSTISELSRGEIREPAHSLGEMLIKFGALRQVAASSADRNRRSTDKNQ